VVYLAAAAQALNSRSWGLGQILGPRAGVPVLSSVKSRLVWRCRPGLPRQRGHRGSAISPHNALLLMVTRASMVDWEAGSWLQAGPGGLLLGLVYAVLGPMLGLGGWLRRR
jgi:hypothetical protein